MAVLESAAFNEALALADSQGMPADMVEFRVMFLYEDESGSVHPFAASVDFDGRITAMRAEQGISEEVFMDIVAGTKETHGHLSGRFAWPQEFLQLEG